MPADNPKGTGRTLWDFLSSLLENRAALYWASAIAWLLLIGTVVAVSSGVLSVQMKGMTGSPSSGTSPFVHWSILTVDANVPECGNVALQSLQRASPVKIEAGDVERGLSTNVADFGTLTGWITCIGMRERSLIYIGVAGNDFSDGKNKTAQLKDLVTSRLPRRSK